MLVKSPGSSPTLKGTQLISGTFSADATSQTLDGQTGFAYMDITISALDDYTKAVAEVTAGYASSTAPTHPVAQFIDNTTLRLWQQGTNPVNFEIHVMEFMPMFDVFHFLTAFTAASDVSAALGSDTSKKKMLFNGGFGSYSGGNASYLPTIEYNDGDDKLYITSVGGGKKYASVFVVDTQG